MNSRKVFGINYLFVYQGEDIDKNNGICKYLDYEMQDSNFRLFDEYGFKTDYINYLYSQPFFTNVN